MKTKELFRDDSYLKSCSATVTATGENRVFVDRTVFYPLGGGQPGDTGTISWDGGNARIVHMRMHTAMHLLGSILQYGVTGGNISATKSRLDFDMTDTVDKEAVSTALAALVAEDHAVSCRWISEEELDANPELVRTMSVQPPRGRGSIRLLEIEGIDLQPCGGTHVRSTAEIGAVRIGKVEKKGRQNRRVNIHLDG
jgi:misacylated tRNA(Ala) deacylase